MIITVAHIYWSYILVIYIGLLCFSSFVYLSLSFITLLFFLFFSFLSLFVILYFHPLQSKETPFKERLRSRGRQKNRESGRKRGMERERKIMLTIVRPTSKSTNSNWISHTDGESPNALSSVSWVQLQEAQSEVEMEIVSGTLDMRHGYPNGPLNLLGPHSCQIIF